MNIHRGVSDEPQSATSESPIGIRRNQSEPSVNTLIRPVQQTTVFKSSDSGQRGSGMGILKKRKAKR